MTFVSVCVNFCDLLTHGHKMNTELVKRNHTQALLNTKIAPLRLRHKVGLGDELGQVLCRVATNILRRFLERLIKESIIKGEG